jgi:two-component sensor histidine kinase/ActR/RegA family two-component response regulator
MVASGLGDWSWNALTDSITLSSRAASFFGLQPASSITWSDLSRLLIDGDRERVQSAMITALLNDEPFDLEYRIIRPDNGQTRWLAQRARAEFSAEGEAIGLSGVVRDVTDERTALERERLLAREVDHRAKNALAVVQSLVRLTPFTSKEEYVATVTGRIHAMARVHTLLSRNSWNGATIDQIVREELAPFESDGRFEIQGPDVELSLEAAQPLSLLIHELTTNASKYGALSVPTGCVCVGWTVTGDGGVQLTWTESGGPAPPTTGTSGFGTRLIRGAASQLGGVVEQEWRPSGLRCTLSIAMFQTKASPAAPPTVFSKRQRTTRLKGSRILVVEDEVLLAMETANHLAAAGATVIGPANTLPAGLSMAASEQIDGAVLDLNLGGQSAEPLLQFLSRMKVPFVVITGYESAGIQVPVLLRKPVEYPTLVEALSEQLSKAGRRRIAASSARLATP